MEYERSTVSTKVFGSGDVLDRVSKGATLTVARAEKALLWFSDKWPASVPWPSSIERPQALQHIGDLDINNPQKGKKGSAPSYPPLLPPTDRGGLMYEDFMVGHVFIHRLTRTVTQADNILFSNLTLNPQPLHIDSHFCETQTVWGRPLMNSLFTLGLMIGIAVNDTTLGTLIANLGMSDVRFPAPLFEGDTVHAATEVIAMRPSQSRPEAGIITFEHRAYKQDGTLIAIATRQALMQKREVTQEC